MNHVKITCKKCGESIMVVYKSSLGHVLTDEALAIKRATDNHICKSSTR